MANYPTWSPNVGERFGNWIGVAIGTFTFWDIYLESEDEVKVSQSYPAKSNGQEIDADVRAVLIDSESTASYVELPSIDAFGVGNTLFVQAGQTAFRIRCKYEDYEAAINNVVCNKFNELFVPANTIVTLKAVGEKNWLAEMHNSDGTPLPSSPRTRGSVVVVRDDGQQELVAMDPTDIYTDYDGTDDSFLLDPADPINTSTLLSVAAWVRTDTTSPFEAIVGSWNTTSNQKSWILGIYTSNKFIFYTSNDGTASDLFATSGTYTDDVWVHVAVTYNAGSIKVYLNNGSAETDTSTQTTLYTTNAELGIGSNNTNQSGFWDGRIAHLVIEGAEWSSGTVSNIYNSAPPSTAHYFPFGNGVEKRRTIDAITKNSEPTTVSTIPTVDPNCKRAWIYAENSRQISMAPQLRAGQECIIRTNTSHKMVFPKGVNGQDIQANETVVSDWKAVMTLTADYDYSLKALTDNYYQVVRTYKDGDPSSTPSFT